MTAPDIIAQLVERFDRNRDDYRSDRYNETQLRRRKEVQVAQNAATHWGSHER